MSVRDEDTPEYAQQMRYLDAIGIMDEESRDRAWKQAKRLRYSSDHGQQPRLAGKDRRLIAIDERRRAEAAQRRAVREAQLRANAPLRSRKAQDTTDALELFKEI